MIADIFDSVVCHLVNFKNYFKTGISYFQPKFFKPLCLAKVRLGHSRLAGVNLAGSKRTKERGEEIDEQKRKREPEGEERYREMEILVKKKSRVRLYK